MKTLAILFSVIGGIFIFIGGGLIVRTLMLPVRVVSKSVETTEGVIDKTLNADNAVYNYEWFKQQEQDIIGVKAKIANSLDAVDNFEKLSPPRKEWTFEDKDEYSRLQSVKLGLQNQLQDMVADYNARAKMANRSIFLTGKIPAVIEIGAQWLK